MKTNQIAMTFIIVLFASAGFAQWTANSATLTKQEVIGSNHANDRTYAGYSDRARAGIYDLLPESGTNERPSGEWNFGLEVRERTNVDSLAGSLPRRSYGGLFNAVAEFTSLHQNAFGLAGLWSQSYINVPWLSDTDWNNAYPPSGQNPYAQGLATSVSFFRPESSFTSNDSLRTGVVKNAIGGIFTIIGDNSHFRHKDGATITIDNSKPCIGDAVGVEANYVSGFNSTTLTTGDYLNTAHRYGALVDTFTGLRVGAQLKAGYGTYSATEANYDPDYDRIKTYRGIHVTAPTKEIKANTSTADQQAIANAAFQNTCYGIFIDSPVGPASNPTSPRAVSPSTYLGLLCNAKAVFNASVDVVAALYAEGTISTAGGFIGNGSSINSLNASNLATGTVADARLSANVAKYNDVTPDFTNRVKAPQGRFDRIDMECVKAGGDTISIGDWVEIYDWDATAAKPKVRRLTSRNDKDGGVAVSVSSNDIVVCTKGVCDARVANGTSAGSPIFPKDSEEYTADNSSHATSFGIRFGTQLQANSSGSATTKKVYVDWDIGYTN